MRHVLRDIGVNDFKASFSGGTLAATTAILANSDALTVLPYSVVFMARRQNALAALSIHIGHRARTLGVLTTQEAEGPTLRRSRRFVEAEFRSLSQIIQQHEQNGLAGLKMRCVDQQIKGMPPHGSLLSGINHRELY